MNHLYEARILLVDDHPDILKMLSSILTRRGFLSIRTASDCQTARKMFRLYEPELVVLDNDRLLGLGLGADDYITKPFLPDELVLRLSAILKRTYFSKLIQEPESTRLVLGKHTILLESGTVRSENGETPLTAKELALLKKLYENRGNIVTFDALSDAVWGENYYRYENTLMVHIRRLREKIEDDPSHPVWLLTVRGLGYKLIKGD